MDFENPLTMTIKIPVFVCMLLCMPLKFDCYMYLNSQSINSAYIRLTAEGENEDDDYKFFNFPLSCMQNHDLFP